MRSANRTRDVAGAAPATSSRYRSPNRSDSRHAPGDDRRSRRTPASISRCHSHQVACQLRGERDREHRLREQRPRGGDRERERRAGGCGRAAGSGPRRPRRAAMPGTARTHEPAVAGLAGQHRRPSGGIAASDHAPQHDHERRPRPEQRRRAASTQRARPPSSGSDDHSAKPDASEQPDRGGDARSPSFGPSSRTPGRRERVQAEEARPRSRRRARRGRAACVGAPPGGDADGPAERGRDRGGAEHEPEVRRVVLPREVGVRHGQQRERGPPAARAPR